MVLAEGDEIGAAEFPQVAAQMSAEQTAPDGDPPVLPAAIAPLMIESPPTATVSILPPEMPASALSLLDEHGEVVPLEDIEARAIRFAITHYRGQMSEVARKLRIGRSTLYRKLESLGLAADDTHTDDVSAG